MDDKDLELFSQQTDSMPGIQALQDSDFRKWAIAFFPILALWFPAAAAVGVAADTLFNNWVQNLQAERAENLKRYLGYQLPYLKRQITRQSKRLGELEERFNDPEYRRVLSSFTLEAAREAMDERMKMLAAATAGSANLKLEIGQAARIERKLRELDPEDVKALWIIYRTIGNVDLDGTVYGTPLQLKAEVVRRVGTDVLESGLLRRTWGGFGGGGDIQHTVLGALVLDILEEYLRERIPDSMIPGRHHRESDRDPRIVQDVIAAHPALATLLDRVLEVAADAGGRYFLPNTRTDNRPYLLLEFRRDDKVDFVENELKDIEFVKDELEVEYGEETVTMEKPSDTWIRGFLIIRGKHDVLRTIADSRGWEWHDA